MKSLLGLTAITAFLTQTSLAAPPLARRQNSTDWTAQEWDVIVVGAGTAGIIVADRLSEAGKKTMLLELGGPSYGIVGGTERPSWLDGTGLSRVDVPGLYKSIFSTPDSELLCPADVVSAFQACTIGGNSAINAGLYFQPPASDWDNYFPAGWKSADVEEATQRLLAKQPSVTSYSVDGKYYLQSGYDAAEEWLVKGAGFSHVSFNEEPNNKDRVFGRPVYNYIDGQRGGPTRTYLQSALKRSNFRLQTGVQVQRINHVGGVASSITAKVDGSIITVPLSRAGRVIVSAGAIASPGLLIHSGIGPSETLAKLSAAGFISNSNSSAWVANPAVGEGLFDNPNTYIELTGSTIESYAHSYDDPITADKDLYLSSRSGPYAFASQTSAFWGYVDNDDGSRTGVQGTIDSSGYADFTDNKTITLNIYGTSGLKSSGRVILSSEGKFIPGPSSDVYYNDPQDGMSIAKFIHTIFQALPASTPDSPAVAGLTPLNIAQNSTVEEIYTYITTWSKYAVGSVQHWSSSCRIGKCVDADTKVIGTMNIHVIDASIVSPLTVNPQFGVMVAAEKGSERVLKTWG
ncbi:Uu.00g031580.m01.CDS01 [Anthostomella pinea]|uniref:Uu.00g031580.m01.CDS01 n=1 Tax=Anthostomella pinea TaxID=933095 RepID=A0AAI8V9I7_9PEZI|nr:Uu.00g031580.m01.CDS01 [Anthostomella pinea]